MSDELEWIWTEAILAYFEVPVILKKLVPIFHFLGSAK
jgi:hypothetical protein